MAPSLLEAAALEYVPGAGPVRIEPLCTGLVNLSCRVERDGHVYSLRLGVPGSSMPGIDREWECRVLAPASTAGLAPPIRRCEPAAGVLVADWVIGRSWTPAEAARPAAIDAMARLLRRVHALPAPRPARAIGPTGWIDGYLSAGAAGPWSTRLCGEAATHVARALRSTCGAVLCHSDLHRLNVCVGADLTLLDWEYAHVTDPYWDLAGWTANNDGTPAFSRELLAGYLGRPASPDECARLQEFIWLYDYVCLLWSECYLGRGGHDAGVAARARTLALRLGSPGGLAG